MKYSDILSFWFEELTPAQHFASDVKLDELIRARFSDCHRAAAQGELETWRVTPEGRLAEIIVLDQFSRNLFRGKPQAFASDGVALVLAQEAVRAAADQALPQARRLFLYMPFMHSESRTVHATAERLFRALGLAENLKYELAHKAIVDRFGRYPHRNAVLGRDSTPEELEFLQQPGSSF
ncbi:MAG TPA: DUF924 family protein [Gammaproteobacteria bacterium]|nr:DUF924 family protein [Gammaproteobacteria bacterium]